MRFIHEDAQWASAVLKSFDAYLEGLGPRGEATLSGLLDAAATAGAAPKNTDGATVDDECGVPDPLFLAAAEAASVHYEAVAASQPDACKSPGAASPAVKKRRSRMAGLPCTAALLFVLMGVGVMLRGMVQPPTACAAAGAAASSPGAQRQEAIVIRESTPEDAAVSPSPHVPQPDPELMKENEREDPAADAANNAFIPYKTGIEALLEMALTRWGGGRLDGFPDAAASGGSLQYGQGRQGNGAFAWLLYPDGFVLTVAVGKPDDDDPPVAVEGFGRVRLDFDPVRVVEAVRDAFCREHPDLKLEPFVVSVDWRRSGT